MFLSTTSDIKVLVYIALIGWYQWYHLVPVMTADKLEPGEKGEKHQAGTGEEDRGYCQPMEMGCSHKGSRISHVSISSTKSQELPTCLIGFFTSISKICLGLMQGLFKKDDLQNILLKAFSRSSCLLQNFLTVFWGAQSYPVLLWWEQNNDFSCMGSDTPVILASGAIPLNVQREKNQGT